MLTLMGVSAPSLHRESTDSLINAGHKIVSVSGDISWNNATLHLHMHHLSLSGRCVIAG